MQTHRLSFGKLDTVLIEWLKRSQHVNQQIISKVVIVKNQTNRSDYDPYRWNESLIPDYEPSAFEMDPPFSPDAKEAVRRQFIKNPGGRGKKTPK